MISYEAQDGPYGRWLKGVRKKLGDRVFDLMCDMTEPAVQSILKMKGIVPFEDSVEFHRYLLSVMAEKGDAKPPKKPRKGDSVPGADGVRLVPVVYADGGILDVDDGVEEGDIEVHDPFADRP